MKQAVPKDDLAASEELLQFHRRWFLKFDEALHKEAAGPTWLKNEPVAETVKSSLHSHDNEWYKLHV